MNVLWNRSNINLQVVHERRKSFKCNFCNFSYIGTFGRVFLLIGFPLSGGGAAAALVLVGCVAAVRLHHFVALI